MPQDFEQFIHTTCLIKSAKDYWLHFNNMLSVLTLLFFLLFLNWSEGWEIYAKTAYFARFWITVLWITVFSLTMLWEYSLLQKWPFRVWNKCVYFFQAAYLCIDPELMWRSQCSSTLHSTLLQMLQGNNPFTNQGKNKNNLYVSNL